MPKFLGVISNSLPCPSDDCILEYSDLDLLTNLLFDETQNLFCDFQRKLQFINEKEVLIVNNLYKITEIYDFLNQVLSTTIKIERDTNDVGYWLCEMEKAINCMELLPKNFVGCKCALNLMRNETLDMLVKLSENMICIANKIESIEECEKSLPVENSCDSMHKIVQILDLHMNILEQNEQKIYKMTDLIRKIDGCFINWNRRRIGACYHKPSYEYASNC